MMIKVTNKINTYDSHITTEAKVEISSHWNDRDMVVITVHAADEDLQVTVVGKELKAAIDNAMNTCRF